MILIQIVRSVAFLLSQTILRPCNSASDVAMFPDASAVPSVQQDSVRAMSLSVERLHTDTEERLGIYFKIINLFCSIAEHNASHLEKYGQSFVAVPLNLFTALFRLKFLKELLIPYLKQITSRINSVAQTPNLLSREEFQEDFFSSHIFDEEAFVNKVKSSDPVLDCAQLSYWLQELETQLKYCQAIREITDKDLVPVVDVMTQLFEEKIEEFIESGRLNMKELQAFYKLRTQVLHSRIKELNTIVHQQNQDIRTTRSFYTEEMGNLKDEVSGIKTMASQLEIMQQSADICLNEEVVPNNDLDQVVDNSFEKGQYSSLKVIKQRRSPTFKKPQIGRQNSQLSLFDKQRSQVRTSFIRDSAQKQMTASRHGLSRHTDKFGSTSQLDSRSNSQLSNNQYTSIENPHQPQPAYFSARQPVQQKLLQSVEQDTETGKFGKVGEFTYADKLFTQSPIHGVLANSNTNVFASMDDFVSQARKIKPTQRDRLEEAFIEETPKDDQVANFSSAAYRSVGHQSRFNQRRANTQAKASDSSEENPLQTYESNTIPSHPGTFKNGKQQIDSFPVQNDDFEDLLERRDISSSDEEDQRENYLNQSMDKLDSNDNGDAFDINPDDQDIGSSLRSPTQNKNGQNENLKRLAPDRMTPEFKLNSEEGLRKISRQESLQVSQYYGSPDQALERTNLMNAGAIEEEAPNTIGSPSERE